MKQQRNQVVTFKADDALIEALAGVPNRSEFIRSAVVAALDGACPLCKGTGILTPSQRHHWERFAKTHLVEECEDCHALHLVCQAQTRQTRKGAKHE